MNLTQFIDNDNNPSQLVASNGGTILVPILTTPDGVNLNLNGTGTLDTSGLLTITMVRLLSTELFLISVI